jgi:hypothetical protein
MNKNISNYNDKHEFHGYQELYNYHNNNIIAFRCKYINSNRIGYSEWHGFKQTRYYIK